MSLITSRTNKNAFVDIDYSKCNHCGLCVNVCKDLTLQLKDDKVVINSEPLFGCIGCGQCVAICLNEVISLEGRILAMDDFIPLPPKEEKANYSQLHSLLISRRSVRDFKDKEIPADVVERILKASCTAPMGIPPSDVEVLVLLGKDKVKNFSDDVIDFIAQTNKFINKHTLWL